jgi:drug/metabolite transporter (DMT)-like permease
VIAEFAGLFAALGAAAAWGTADFLGGVATRRSRVLDVLVLSRLAGVLLLAALAGVTRDPLPPAPGMWWAAAAGFCGAVGIAALYKGLASSESALVAPTVGVLGAAVPVLFAIVVHGVLPLHQQVGLVVALSGIWLVSVGHDGATGKAARGLIPAIVAGVGFGGYFILLAQVRGGAAFTPLVASVGTGLLLAGLAAAVARSGFPSPRKNPVALGAGLLDALGAVGYLAAIRWIRLDVAAVLASLYPAVTVLWFWRLAQERVSPTQWVGLVVCVAAIALIAL